LLTAELRLGTVAALFATVPRESPPETGQVVKAWPVFSFFQFEQPSLFSALPIPRFA